MTIKEYVAARKITMRDEISKTGKIPHFVVEFAYFFFKNFAQSKVTAMRMIKPLMKS